MSAQVQIFEYVRSRPELFDTKPALHPVLGMNVCCWKAPRLKLRKDGVELLKNPEDFLVIFIDPKTEIGYEAGYFIITKSGLEREPVFQQAMSTQKSFLEAGYFHWEPPGPKEMYSYFFPVKPL